MADTPERTSVHDLEGDELAQFIAAHTARWGFPPLAGADGADDGGDGDEDGDSSDDDQDDDGDKDGADDDKDVDWKAKHDEVRREARKWERRAKRQNKSDDKDAGKGDGKGEDKESDPAKAIERAKAEAKAEALAEVDQERRSARLEVEVTRAAAGTFADTEDALIQIERAIAKGDIDVEDIFDDEGKVQTDALATELEQLLKRKPHLAAKDGGEDSGKPKARIRGGSGAGKGTGKGKDLAGMTPADHEKALRAKRSGN